MSHGPNRRERRGPPSALTFESRRTQRLEAIFVRLCPIEWLSTVDIETAIGDGIQMTLRKPRVLVTCPSFEPGHRGGGPIRSVARIVDSASEDIEVRLVTSDRDVGTSQPYPGLSGQTIERGRTLVTYLDRHSARQWLRFVRELRRESFDVLYVNSLWEPWFSQLPLLLAALHVLRVRTVLIAPRGELSKGALGLKARKKRAVLPLVRLMLRMLDVRWHASTKLEADDILSSIPRAAPRAIVICADVSSAQIHPLGIEPHAPPIRFVFISRISPKKNLDLAISALAFVTTEATLDVYGPLEDKSYWARCEEHIAPLPSHITVTYRGELPPHDVPATFARCDAFVFPTRGENFGHVIPESLAAACPVICSDLTPWTPVLEAGGGAVVRDLTPRGVGEVLACWAIKPRNELIQARVAAQTAFLDWHAAQDGTNILDLVTHHVPAG